MNNSTFRLLALVAVLASLTGCGGHCCDSPTGSSAVCTLRPTLVANVTNVKRSETVTMTATGIPEGKITWFVKRMDPLGNNLGFEPVSVQPPEPVTQPATEVCKTTSRTHLADGNLVGWRFEYYAVTKDGVPTNIVSFVIVL